jgi:hypothetical protein
VYAIKLGDTIDTEIGNWMKNSGVEVTGEARALVRSGFLGQEIFLKTVVEAQHLTVGQQQGLASALIAFYLYEVRDAKLRAAASASPDTAKKGWFTTAFQGSALVLKIDVEDVRRVPIAEFLVTIFPKFNAPVGSLIVTSQPAGSDITIDSVAKGATRKDFVLSVGSHEAAVTSKKNKHNCKKHILIEANTTERFNCAQPSK